MTGSSAPASAPPPTATLGLLETDTLDADLIGEYGSYGKMFARYFDALDGQLTYRYYQVQDGELPRHPAECDAYLITGSKAGVYDSLPWLAPLARWIADFHTSGAKIIGICFGHQMVAHSLGGLAAKSPRGWRLGVHAAQIYADDCASGAPRNRDEPIPPMAELRLIHSHQDQVERLPPNANVLAGSPFCPYAAFAIDHRVLCFQGHPEFTPGYFRRLFARRDDGLADSQLDAALATLAEPTDHEWVGRRLLGFIRNSADEP